MSQREVWDGAQSTVSAKSLDNANFGPVAEGPLRGPDCPVINSRNSSSICASEVAASEYLLTSANFSTFSLNRSLGAELSSNRFNSAVRLAPIFEQLQNDSLLLRGFGNFLLAIETSRRPELYKVGQAWDARFDPKTDTVSFARPPDSSGRTDFPAKLVGIESRRPSDRPAVELLSTGSAQWNALSPENRSFNNDLKYALSTPTSAWLTKPVTTYPSIDFDPLWHWVATVAVAAGSESVPFVIGHWASGRRQALLVDMESGLAAVKKPSADTALDFFAGDLLSSWDACFNGYGKCRIPQPGRTLSVLARMFGLHSHYFVTEEGRDAGKVVVWDGASVAGRGENAETLPSGLLISLEKVRQRGLEFPSSLPRLEEPKDRLSELLELLTLKSEITPQMIKELRRRANSGSFKCSARHFNHLDAKEAAEVRAVIGLKADE